VLNGSQDAMFELRWSLANRRFERAAQLLEQAQDYPETEAMWATVCHAAFEDSNLEIAERCWKRLGDEARADFLRKQTGVAGAKTERASAAREQVRSEVGESSERAAMSPSSVGRVASNARVTAQDALSMSEAHRPVAAHKAVCTFDSEGIHAGDGLPPRRKKGIPVYRAGMKYRPGTSRSDLAMFFH